jgi:hypothetical protein
MQPLYTFYHVLFAIAFCGGIYAVSMIRYNLLNDWRIWMESRIARGFGHRWIAHPILLCDTCMASVYGTLVYLLFFLQKGDWLNLAVWWIPFLFQVALGNYALWTLISTLRAIRNHYVNSGRTQVQHPESTGGPSSH